nr:ACP S-malonyltransferase [Arachnia propionica]
MANNTYLFSGQGAQYPGMGKELCLDSQVAARTFEEASDALGLDMRALCFDSSNAELALTANTQPAILTLSIAQFRTIAEREVILPDVLAGHSLGEISALCAAGAIDFADAVRIARLRGTLMQQAVPQGEGLMVALQTRDHPAVKQMCEEVAMETGEVISISNYNSNTQVVIAGAKASVLRLQEVATQRNWRAVVLNVSVPFHCALMEPVVEPLRAALNDITLHPLQVPVLSNVTAEPYESFEQITELLPRQVVEPVRWVDIMTWLRMHNTVYGVEVGPGEILTKLMRHTYGIVKVFPYDRPEGVAGLRRMVRRTTIPFVARALGVAAATRNNNSDNEAYGRGVARPYQEMRKLSATILREERDATPDEMRHGLKLLTGILTTKKVPVEEQADRIRQLFHDSATQGEFADFDYASLR